MLETWLGMAAPRSSHARRQAMQATVGRKRVDLPGTNTTRAIVAPEASGLAEALRRSGWVTCATWEATTDAGERVWYVQFEAADVSSN
jgi:hypothetical protein